MPIVTAWAENGGFSSRLSGTAGGAGRRISDNDGNIAGFVQEPQLTRCTGAMQKNVIDCLFNALQVFVVGELSANVLEQLVDDVSSGSGVPRTRAEQLRRDAEAAG